MSPKFPESVGHEKGGGGGGNDDCGSNCVSWKRPKRQNERLNDGKRDWEELWEDRAHGIRNEGRGQTEQQAELV